MLKEEEILREQLRLLAEESAKGVENLAELSIAMVKIFCALNDRV